MKEPICKCGHPKSDHYEYILNGHPQIRCKKCDPHSNRSNMPTHYAMTSGSAESDMYLAADHDFEEKK